MAPEDKRKKVSSRCNNTGTMVIHEELKEESFIDETPKPKLSTE